MAEGYEPAAFALAKEHGVIPATPSSLFGFDVASALRELMDVLKDVFPREETLERVDEVFKRLSHIEGAATNLRGALFEYVAAEVVRCNSAHTHIQLNEILRDDLGRVAEVDVLAHHANQSVRFIECKGYKPGGIVPDEMVSHWLENRVPLIRQAAARNPFWNKCGLEFEFWTTGVLSPEAKALVKNAAAKVRKYKLKVVDCDELSRMVKATNNTSLKKTFQEHFWNHPLNKAERPSKAGRRLPKPQPSQLHTRTMADRSDESDTYDDT